jgi:hypothetical protein
MLPADGPALVPVPVLETPAPSGAVAEVPALTVETPTAAELAFAESLWPAASSAEGMTGAPSTAAAPIGRAGSPAGAAPSGAAGAGGGGPPLGGNDAPPRLPAADFVDSFFFAGLLEA